MPIPSSAPRLGDLERAVMEHLWEFTLRHPEGATVRQVLESFEGERQIAYTTVMTVLDRLAKKELLDRDRVGRAWRYRPADTRAALTAQTMRTLLDEVDSAHRRAALVHFLEEASPDELDDLRAALTEVASARPASWQRHGPS